MADYNSGLPVRTEADGTDERLHAKIVDGANPSQMATVDTDLNLHVELHGNDPTGADQVVRTSEIGALTPDGIYDATNNTIPGNLATIVHERAITPGAPQSTIRATGINSSVNTDVWAQDVAIRDENGNPFSASNPLPTTSVDSEGLEVNNFDQSGAPVAANGTSNHDYTVTALKTLKLSHIYASGSGKIKIEVQVEGPAATFTTKFVSFNSTAKPDIDIWINENIAIAAGLKVRVIRTNKDNQSQDLYSTICGHEI